MDAEPGMEVYDPCYSSGGLLIKCQIAATIPLSPSGERPRSPRKNPARALSVSIA